jgi:hypothetical protein
VFFRQLIQHGRCIMGVMEIAAEMILAGLVTDEQASIAGLCQRRDERRAGHPLGRHVVLPQESRQVAIRIEHIGVQISAVQVTVSHALQQFQRFRRGEQA